MCEAATQSHASIGSHQYDFDDVLREIAPRPTLIFAPEFDRNANLTDVTAAVHAAAPAWSGHEKNLNFTVVEGWVSSMVAGEVFAVSDWLNGVLEQGQ